MNAILHKLRTYTGYLVMLHFLFPVNWASYLIGLWALFCLIIAVIQIKKIRIKDILQVVLYTTPFIWMVISVNIHGGHGNAFIERSLSFLVFPVCVFLSGFQAEKDTLKKLTWVFAAGCLALAVKGLVAYLCIPFHHTYDVQHDLMFRYRTEFNINTGIAPTYACIYFSFAILLMLLQWKEMGQHKGMYLFLLISLFIQMLILSAKMPVVAFFVVLMILLVRKEILPGLINRKRTLWIGAAVAIMVSLLLVFTRWSELWSGLNYRMVDEKENSVGIRRGILQCSLELTHTYFWQGTGPQHLQKKLNQCYYQFEGNDFDDRHEFNTHNQYLDYLLTGGIAGLLVLISVLIVPLYIAIRQRDPFLLAFILLIAICMLTENILSRQAGIVFYAFFNAVLVRRANAL